MNYIYKYVQTQILDQCMYYNIFSFDENLGIVFYFMNLNLIKYLLCNLFRVVPNYARDFA